MSDSNLPNLLKSLKEALQYWVETIKDSQKLGQIKAALVPDPLAELTKLAQLIRAHTTKVGIIFNPKMLNKSPQESYRVVQKLSETTVLLVSVAAQLSAPELSDIFYTELLESIQQVLTSEMMLVDQLVALEANSSQPSTSEVAVEADGRLVAVGKVWSSCDNLCTIVGEGKLGVLNRKFKLSISLVEDGLEEFEEWAQDPEEMEDPFGFSDSEEDDDDETQQEKPPLDMDEDVKQQVIEYSQEWIRKFKLIKLLLISVSKSLPSVTSAENINTIYQAQRKVVTNVDKMVVDLMVNCKVTQEIKQYGIEITKQCNSIMKIVKEVNKSNESKVKWCDTWSDKFQ